MPNIDTEIANKFYRPAKRSIEIYRETKKAIQDAVVENLAPSGKRLFKFWSLLLAVSVLQIAATCHA